MGADKEESDWTFSTKGTYNDTEGASYAGFNFTLKEEMIRASVSSTPATAEFLQTLELDYISITTRGGKDVTGTYSMYVVDNAGKLIAVAANNITLDTDNVATAMKFNFAENSSYGNNLTLTAGSKYYAYILDSAWMSNNWSEIQIGATIPGSNISSIQLAAYKYGNNTAQAEWGCATLNRGVVFENFAPIATVSVHSIPEPTTATLSLLALAGLAARRRRK